MSGPEARGPARSQRLERRLDVGDVAADLDLAPHLTDHAVLVDQEGGAVDAHVLAAVQALLDPGTVLLADLAVFVGHQGEGEAVLGLELVVARHAVLADADHLRFQLLEGGGRIAEAAGLGGAARRVVFGIEIEHHRLAAQLAELELAAAVRRAGEIRRLLAFVDAHASLLAVQPAARAGASMMRWYIARAATVSAASRARSAAMSGTSWVRAIRRRWPSGARPSSNDDSSPLRVRRSRLCTSDIRPRAARSWPASPGASRWRSAARRSTSAGWTSRISGRSAA